MKNFLSLIACALLALTAQNVSAQSGIKDRKPEERATMQTEWMARSLQLDSTQKSEAAVINLKYALKMEPVLQGGGRRMAKLQQARDINKQKEAELKKVFSGAQWQTYQQRKEELRAQMQEKRKGN